jgi:Glycosyl transferase family 8
MSELPSFFQWLEARPGGRAKPWLILGKGPSYGKLKEFDTSRFETLSLNHVVREGPVTTAHIIDMDVVDDCGDALLANAQVLVMPWQPHRKNWVAKETLGELARSHPVLAALAGQGRLAWYNLGTGKTPREGSPVVPVRYFSAVAALGLLAQAGVRTVRSLGVDGGASYSAAFEDIAGKTKLSNGWSSFDLQFEEFPSIILRTGVDYSPLHAETPIRVYVAATDSELLPMRVLEYSIKKHCSVTTQVLPLHRVGIDVPVPRDAKNRARTPFSFQRFLIPEAAGRHGRAIYLDADMQLFSDIRRLWETPLEDADILAVWEPEGSGRDPQFSVMMLNCATLDWSINNIVAKLDQGEMTYEDLMSRMAAGGRVARVIDPAWNSLERYVEGETALLHYTDMNTQPWVHAGHRFGYLWTRDLLRAIKGGQISRDLVAEHVERGWVRPSLLVQVDENINDSLLLSRAARRLDRGFVAPFRKIDAARWAGSTLAVLPAVARDLFYRSSLPHLVRVARARFFNS